MISEAPKLTPSAAGHRRPGQQVVCGWCGKSVPVPSRGRVPKWCSATCRNRAWQTNHNPGERPVRVVQQRIEVPVGAPPHDVDGWVELLEQLTARLAQGRIYKRDLPTLVPAINHLLEVAGRRLRER